MSEDHLGAAGLARHLGSWQDEGGASYLALAARVRALLLDGRLAPGTRMPSERDLALTLDVGRGTAAAAYEDLRTSGHLVRRRGSGTWTALPTPTRGPMVPFAPTSGSGRSLDLAHAAPPAPADAVRAAGAAALADLDEHLDGPGYDVLGLPALRAAVAARLEADGLPTAPDEVLVCGGAQHAHALVARALVRPGDRVLLEQPTYPNAVDLVRHVSARPVPVALDPCPRGGGDGWDVPSLVAGLRESTPSLAYLVPDHQNPTGAVMSEATRGAVAAACRRHGVPLVVDDSLREMWLDGPPPAPLGSWARRGAGGPPVITLGSLSKTVWGGLRVGWVRAPRAVLRRIAAARSSDDLSTPVFEQLLAVHLLEELDTILPPRRAVLTAARDHVLDALAAVLPEWTATRPRGGLSLWVDLGAPRSSSLVEAAARQDLALAAGPRFGTGGAFEGYLRVPYIQPLDVLDDAVDRLASVWRGLVPVETRMATVV